MENNPANTMAGGESEVNDEREENHIQGYGRKVSKSEQEGEE